MGHAAAVAVAEAPGKATENWGLLGTLGFDRLLAKVDNATRSNFTIVATSPVSLDIP